MRVHLDTDFWLAVGALVFLYFLLTGRSRELTIGEGA